MGISFKKKNYTDHETNSFALFASLREILFLEVYRSTLLSGIEIA